MTIGEWLNLNTSKLQIAGIKTARLDCLILLEYITERDRSWLLVNQDISLDAIQAERLTSLIAKRLARHPIAYLTSRKEFYGLNMTVTLDVLIPRPETEQLLEALIRLQPKPSWKIIDIGTGSGAIAIAAKHLYPDNNVSATDISDSALKVARQNALAYNLDLNLVKTNLLDKLGKYNVIIANLPYIDSSWQVSPETKHEPQAALYANKNGLELIYKLLEQASKDHLESRGYIILEHDPRQTDELKLFAHKLNYRVIESQTFSTTLQVLGN